MADMLHRSSGRKNYEAHIVQPLAPTPEPVAKSGCDNQTQQNSQQENSINHQPAAAEQQQDAPQQVAKQ